MRMKQKKALVLGATGLIGGHCLRLLLSDDRYNEVRAAVRRPLAIEHPKLREQVVDFERLENARQFFAVDDVFCCLGSTMKKAGSREAFRHIDYDYSLNAAKLALAAGATSFMLVSSISADAGSSNFYLSVKGQLEEAVSKLGFQSVIAFRPSLLLGKRNESRFLEGVGIRLLGPTAAWFRGPLRRYRPIEAEEVAATMIQAATTASSGFRVHHFG